MFKARRVLVSVCLAFLAASTGWSQITGVGDDQSTPIPGAGHDYIHLLSETVNPANGSVSVRIQVPMPKGRGLTLPFTFAYDSDVLNHAYSSSPGSGALISDAGYLSQGGWSYTAPVMTNIMETRSSQNPPSSCGYFDDYVFQGASGDHHSLYVAYVQYPDSSGCQTVQPPLSTVTSGTDGIYSANISNTGTGATQVIDPDGTVYNFSNPSAQNGFGGLPIYESLPSTVEDRNGNLISYTDLGNGSFYETDTTGRKVISTDGFGNTSTGDHVTVSGLPNPYVVTWTTFNYLGYDPEAVLESGSRMNCVFSSSSGVQETAITSIKLPNGQSYTFSYDPTYGTLSKVQFPTGGYVEYKWGFNALSDEANFLDTTDTQGSNCFYYYGSPVVMDRYVYNYEGATPAEHQTFTNYTTNWVNFTTGWGSKKTTVTTYDDIRSPGDQTSGSFVTTYQYSPVALTYQPNDDTGYALQVPVEQSITYQDWGGASGTTLRTVNKTFAGQFAMTCQSTTQGNLTSRIDYTYGAGTQLTDKKEWDWGQAQACGNSDTGNPRRETQITYQGFGNTPLFPSSTYPLGAPIYDRPSTVTVSGNGTQAAQTTYAYDGSGLTGSGVGVGHDSAYSTSVTVRGNVTEKTEVLLNGCSGCTSPVTTYTYDDTGQQLSMTDPRSKTTNYSYSDNYASGSPDGQTNAYLTLLTLPSTTNPTTSHVEKFSYNYADGQLASSTDQNSQKTSYTYDDSLDRLTQINYPDGGETLYCYHDGFYSVGVSPPLPSVTTIKQLASGSSSTCLNPGSNFQSVAAMDGLGHPTQTQVTSDPVSTDYTLIQYDGSGRKYQEWNPTCCNLNTSPPPTSCSSETSFGITTYTYDALGRPATEGTADAILMQDGSATDVTNGVSGLTNTYCTETTDPATKTRTTCADGLGRLAAVIENPGGLNYKTLYTYDALDNLLTVTQGTLQTPCGGYSRQFTYDSLSRQTSACNPESGTVSYTQYDGNGNLLTRVAPEEDQTGSTMVTTSYTYDALNRLTSKNYNDTPRTPTAMFSYDESSVTAGSWSSPSLTNTIGRLTHTRTGGTSGSFTAYDLNPAHLLVG